MVFLTVSRQGVSGSEGQGGTVTGGEDEKEYERVNKEAAEEGNRFKQCDKRDEKWE